jgi:hypothetical protein
MALLNNEAFAGKFMDNFSRILQIYEELADV